MSELLYVDTSALLDYVLQQKRYRDIETAIRDLAERGGRLVSSRLLHLEIHRAEVRESLAGRNLRPLAILASQVNSLPVTDDVWKGACDIPFHVKALDAIHLSTCALIDGVLLSSDRGMLTAALALNLVIHPASGT